MTHLKVRQFESTLSLTSFECHFYPFRVGIGHAYAWSELVLKTLIIIVN